MSARRTAGARRTTIALAIVAAGAVAVRAAPGGPACHLSLVEIARESGIDFEHHRALAGERHFPDLMGSGVAWIDFDGDGWLDLYAVQSGPIPPDAAPAAANRLYRNLGDGRFVDVTATSGAGDRGYGLGVVAVDFDGDGDSDLYLTNFGPDVLLENRGTGRFVDTSREHGLGLGGWSSSAAFADADGDGDLDLYVTRYVEPDPRRGYSCGSDAEAIRSFCDPSAFRGQTDRFFRQDENGRFVDATASAGIAPADGRGLGVVFTDLDGDGDADLYVANDLTLNFFFANRGDGTFEDLSLLSGTAVNRDGKPEAGMGIAVADVDGDLDPDVGVTNFDVETNTLYLNLGDGLFEDGAAATGFGPPSLNLLAFGIVAVDLDRDGDLDFYIGDGHLFPRPPRDNVAYAERDQVLLNDGRGRFVEARCPVLTARPEVSRGVAWADFDDDGDPDVAVNSNGGRLALLRDDAAAGGWLGVRLIGEGRNREAVGARVVLTTERSRQARWILAGDSYESSSDRRALFAVADGDRPVSLEIDWPGGRRTSLDAPPAGRYLTVWERGPEPTAGP